MRQEKQLVETIIKTIAEYPEDVSVEVQDDERGCVLYVSINPFDTARIIGTKGVIIEAIRSIIKSLGFKQKMAIAVRLKQ
jgi:uncharacterized protein